MVVNYLQFCEIFFWIFAGMIYNWWYLHTRCAWNSEARPRAGVASLSSFLHFLSALEREKLFKWFGILTLVTGEQNPNKKKESLAYHSEIFACHHRLLSLTSSEQGRWSCTAWHRSLRERWKKTKAVCHPLIHAWTSGQSLPSSGEGTRGLVYKSVRRIPVKSWRWDETQDVLARINILVY